MPNNFRLTGNVYVSKAGNDANDGLTPETPKLTIGAGLAVMVTNQTLIIGAGTYKENLAASNIIRIIRADGLVKIIGISGASSFPGGVSLNNIIFQNITINFGAQNAYSINNCIFNNCSMTGGGTFGGSTNVTNSLFINSTITQQNNPSNKISNSILINFNQSSGTYVYDSCYANEASIMRVRTSGTNNNNNILGNLRVNIASTVTSGIVQSVGGVYYDLSIAGTGGSGTLANPFRRGNTTDVIFDYTNFRIAYNNLFPSTNISVAPLFNNPSRYDFTLKGNSPHIGAGVNGSTIGGTNYAVTNYPVSDLEVVSGDTNVTNYVFKAFPQLQIISNVNMNGLLEFNKSQAGGSDENKNVPDFDVFTSGDTTGSNSPDRLTYRMRWSTSASQPVSDSDWDNGGLLTAGNYGVFEWFQQPYVDASGVSSGLYNYSSATRNSITAIWLDIEVTVRNNYTN